MRRSRGWGIALTIQVLVAGCSPSQAPSASNVAKTQLDAMVKEMDGRAVSIEILEISPSALYRVRVQQQQLEDWWDLKTVVRRKDGSELDRIMANLKAASVYMQGAPSDLRSGIIFYSYSDERRLGSLYFDRTGRRGAINQIPVTFGAVSYAELRKMILQPPK
jgi:hypothetical protein